VNGQRKTMLLVMLVALAAGFCTMSYEVLWFRVLKYFVDNSIHSFAIMLTAFLFGLTAGGFLFSWFVDSRKDPFLLLCLMEAGIGLLCMFSIPVISQMNGLIAGLNKVFGEGWSGEIAIRFIVFSLAMLPPALLMGGAFPVFSKLYSAYSGSVGKSMGEVYAINTVGGVLGSFAGGFVLLPLLGVQSGIIAVGFINILTGLACLLAGSRRSRRSKYILSGVIVIIAAVLSISITPNAFAAVYSQRYPPPKNQMVYCRENINGTTTVFQDASNAAQKYLLIDGTGEVSTDYFSIRAFRYLSLLPAVYHPQTKTALIVTFGSGIVAGSIASLPGMEHVDCVEICKEAFRAARYFTDENHDVLDNPKINLIVNDGRNYILTTDRRYDIISADATHPTSSDSWILYTKEFYGLCAGRLNDDGIMCQWIPLHGILERDYRIILKTFHSIFPFVAVYYSGGHKTIGHTVLLGSKKPMRIDYGLAEKLLQDRQVKEDMERMNVLSVQDLLSCFILDQAVIDEWGAGLPLNTDDRPCIIFTKFELENKPFMGIAPLVNFRKTVYPQLYGMDSAAAVRVKIAADRCFEAMGHTLQGQILEYNEYTMRMKQDFSKSRTAVVKNLNESKAIFEQIISEYQTALKINPDDLHTRMLLYRTSSEYEYLNSFLQAMSSR
jgi:spermidine synthase